MNETQAQSLGFVHKIVIWGLLRVEDVSLLGVIRISSLKWRRKNVDRFEITENTEVPLMTMHRHIFIANR